MAQGSIAVAVSFFSMMLVSACASSPSESGPATPTFTSETHLDGRVRIEPETRFIEAQWTIVLDQPETNQLTYWLNANFETVSVTGPGVAGYQLSAEAAPEGINAVIIDLSEPGSDPRRIEIAYSGVLFTEPADGQINSISPQLVELTLDSFWQPFDARFDQRVTAEVLIEAEGDWTPVSSGHITAGGDGLRFVFERPALDLPITLLGEHRVVETGAYRIMDTRETAHDLQPLAETAAFCTEFLDARFGERERLPQASIVIHRRADSGYARGTMISLSDLGAEFSVGDFRFICHELAHFWSLNGNPITVENWLNESFAEYIAILAIGARYGEAAYHSEIERLQQRLARRIEENGSVPSIWSPDDDSRRPHAVTYIKGPLALAALEARLGPALFAEFLRRAMVERIATTPELLAMLDEVAGAEARVWFEAELSR